jgi:Outer membrane protein beta-barrel domain
MKSRLFITLLCSTFAFFAQAQLTPGVRIGLNISQLKGPSELSATGTELESVSNLTGFLIGPSFSYPFTDNFGVRGEVLYSKKGTKYNFNGDVTRSFVQDGDQLVVTTTGKQTTVLQITHNNLDLPVSLYARWGKLEVSGGLYASLFLTKVADGEQIYEWKNQDGTDGKITNILLYNYRRDKPGEGDDAQTEIAYFNNAQTRKSTIPKSLGAYYDYTQDLGSLFKSLDYGVSVGASFYVSRSLFVGGRLQYGLADLTNNSADQSKYERNDKGVLTLRNDKDYNYSFQVFAGFSLR